MKFQPSSQNGERERERERESVKEGIRSMKELKARQREQNVNICEFW